MALGKVLSEYANKAMSVRQTDISIRTGEGHKIRYRGAVSYHTDDPKLAPFNQVIAAVEAETDPVAMTLKGANYEWN